MGTELVGGVSLTATAAIVALVVAATLVAVGVFTGYPIATAFTATGAVVGVGLALGGDPAWGKYREILTLWTLTPFVGGGVAYGTVKLLGWARVDERAVTTALAAVVGAVLANIGFAVLGPAGEDGSIAGTLAAALALPRVGGIDSGIVLATVGVAGVAAGALAVDLRRDLAGGQRRFLLVLGGLVAFSAGGSQVGLALGPLVPLLADTTAPLWALLVGGGFGLLVGSWTGAPRMIKAISQDYASMGPRRSIAALIPSFAIAQVAVAFGIPISFNEIVVSAIVGAGYAAGQAGVSRRKMGYTVLAWVGSLVIAFAFAFGLFFGIDAVVG